MIIEEKSKQAREKAEEIAKDIQLSLLRKGNSVYLTILGSCMYPFVKDGDTVKIVPTEKEDLKIGDIIAVDNESKDRMWLCGHRIIRIFKDNDTVFFVTKSDASREDAGEPVTFDKIKGKVTKIERNGLRIDLESPLWRRLSRYIAKASLKHPKILCTFAPYISLIIEWRWIFSKLKRRMEEPLYNTEELLLICARTHIDKELVNRAKDLLTKGIDWDLFIKTAMKSGLSFIFYSSLKKIDYQAVIPDMLMDKLKKNYLCVVPSITSHHEEAKRVLNLFLEKNIPAVPLKGSFLSKLIYGDMATRGLSADFDLLVKEKNLNSAKEALEEAGYAFVPEDESMAWTQQWVFKKPDGILIELHWGIRPDVQSRERMDGLWKGTRLKDEDGVKYYELKEEELLIFLVAHYIGSKHFSQLMYICDINEILTRYANTLNWQAIIEKSRRWRLSNSVYAAITLSKSLFQTYLPKEALFNLRPNLIKRFLIRIAVNRNTVLRADSFGRRFTAAFLQYLLLQVLEERSLKDVIELIFPPKEIMGGKSYVKRLKGGILKLIRGF